MKKRFVFLFTFALALNLSAQDKKEIYNTELDGMLQLKQAVEQAKLENKHVFVQVGGNWCGWCLLFHQYVNDDPEVKKLLDDQYVPVLLNYSKENQNEEALKKLEFPQRFGYPVFVILNQEGKRIHTQNSALLEEGKGYNKQKVTQFLKHWTVVAVDPASYTK